LGGGFDVLYFTEQSAVPTSLCNVVEGMRTQGVAVRMVAVSSSATQQVMGADITLADADGHFRQRYGVSTEGAAYLLRPDQHVCARWFSLDAPRLQSAFDSALMRSP